MSRKCCHRIPVAVRPPPGLRPRLASDQLRDVALIQLQKVADIHAGNGTAETLTDMVRDVLTWSRAAELIDAGIVEMTEQLHLVARLVDRFARTGQVAFVSEEEHSLARLGTGYMEDLARLVDRDTALAAALWSERNVDAMLRR